MNCNEFQHWLRTRDVFSHETPDALFHISACEACRNLYMTDTGLEKDIRSGFIREELPGDLMGRIDRALDQAKTPIRLNTAGIAAVMAGIALMVTLSFLMVPHRPFRYQDVRQLSETAVLKHLKTNTAMSFTADKVDEGLAMLRKELGFGVTIPDLSAKGYTLIGGRLCFLDTCRIAYLFYAKAETIASLFILSDDHLDFEMLDGTRFSQDIKQHRADIWKENGRVYAMVSSL